MEPTTAAANIDQLAEERYVALTTFTRAGTAKHTPVWPVDAGDGRVGLITSSRTWKVKRIERNARVRLQPCDAKGRVREGATPIEGTARVVVGEHFDSIRANVKDKYGYQLRLVGLLHALPGARTGHRDDCAVIITLDQP